MRRARTPFTLLGLLSALAIAAALGVVGSPKLLYFSPPPSTPGAPAQLAAIVGHTLAAPSFTWHIPQGLLSETLVYQAPDRMRDQMGPTPSVAIRTTFYFQRQDLDSFDDASSESDGNAWVRLRHTPAGYSSAHRYATKFLTALLTATSVRRSGQTFHVTLVDADDPLARGQLESLLTVRTNGSYVSSISVIWHGELAAFGHVQSDNYSYTVQFSRIGASPPVVAPRATTIDHGTPVCGPITTGVSFCAG